MAFQKIDEDAIMGDQPFDSFLLKGMENNINEAYVRRPKRGAISFAYDIRPHYGSVREMILPLSVFPISERAISVEARLFLDVLDEDVIFSPVLLSTDGRIILWEGAEQIIEPGYDQFIDLTFNVIGLDKIAILGLHFISDVDLTSKITIATDFSIPSSGRFNFTSAISDLDPSKRQCLEITPPGSTFRQYDIISITPSKESIKIAPFLVPSDFSFELFDYLNTSLDLYTIGSFKLSGVCFKESFDNADLDAANTLDPGSPATASLSQRLYGLEHEFFFKRTTIHHIGPSVFREIYDIYDDVYSLYGTRLLINDQSWRNIGNNILLQRDTDQLVSGGSNFVRTRTTVYGIVDCGIDRNDLSEEAVEYIDMQIRAVGYSFDSGDEKWNGDEQIYERGEVRVRIKEGGHNDIYQDYRSYLLGASPRNRYIDFPRGLGEMNRASNFSVFSFEWDDTSLERRLVQIQINGDTKTVGGTNIVGYNCFAYIPTYTIVTTPEVI